MDESTPEAEEPSDTKRFLTDSPTIEDIMRRKKPARKSVEIPLDPDVAQAISDKETEIVDVENKLNRERMRASNVAQVGKSLAEGSNIQELTKDLERLEKEFDKLWEDSRESIAAFWFEDIGRKGYSDLVSEHPPTDEQKKEWEAEGGQGKLGYNTDTFPPALIAATSVDPKISLEQANKIFDEWGNWEVIRLFGTAEVVCLGGTNVPKSRRSLTATDATPTSE